MSHHNALNQLAIHGGSKVRTEPWPPRRLFTEEEKAAAIRLFDESIQSGNAFSYNGEEEEAYCHEFAAFMGGGYADAVNSGTAAIYVALRALDLEPFTEVIVPPITDMGGVMPVPLINCIPIPADCARDSYNVGPEEVAARITERTSAIIVAHIAGHPVDMDPIMELAASKGIPVIEDAAQSHGATYKGQLVGTIGDISAFSTMSGKHHATGPQGGIVYTRNEDMYWRARRAADRGKPFGLTGVDSNVTCALNLNLNDLSAAIGRVQINRLPGILAACRQAGGRVVDACQGLQAVTPITGLPFAESAFWFLPFKLDLTKVSVDIDTFVRGAAGEGIPFSCHYVKPFTRHQWYKTRNVFGSSGYPWTSPSYKGNPGAEYPLPHFDEVDASFFFVKVHENVTEREAADIGKALAKAEAAWLL